MHKVPVGVLGASGYAGRELCGLIARHPKLELAFASANEQRGQRARIGPLEVTYVATEDAPLGSAEIVFTALPHGASAKWVENARSTGARVRPPRRRCARRSGSRGSRADARPARPREPARAQPESAAAPFCRRRRPSVGSGEAECRRSSPYEHMFAPGNAGVNRIARWPRDRSNASR